MVDESDGSRAVLPVFRRDDTLKTACDPLRGFVAPFDCASDPVREDPSSFAEEVSSALQKDSQRSCFFSERERICNRAGGSMAGEDVLALETEGSADATRDETTIAIAVQRIIHPEVLICCRYLCI